MPYIPTSKAGGFTATFGKIELLEDLILLLATETNIDFAAKDNYGKTAADYFKDTHTGRPRRGFRHITKLLNTIQNDKARLGQEDDETFSDIGF